MSDLWKEIFTGEQTNSPDRLLDLLSTFRVTKHGRRSSSAGELSCHQRFLGWPRSERPPQCENILPMMSAILYGPRARASFSLAVCCAIGRYTVSLAFVSIIL
ncbi:hypothetical protein BV22DRAFT_536307 [Leucogyrophana mollusca]|uniref:Uncharacterized protein n=1 Tax=Leucogyrophana mollusca TaxID=85980 RepID=A0ACB8BF42_9AGAM|nr:hypothetical protein BV22DRAFT_536307 [Leucogyrophana mollusca]